MHVGAQRFFSFGAALTDVCSSLARAAMPCLNPRKAVERFLQYSEGPRPSKLSATLTHVGEGLAGSAAE
jgi:hypothetical protein